MSGQPAPVAGRAAAAADAAVEMVDEKLIDRALTRVLEQKCELGLLDPGWAPAEPREVEQEEARAERRRAAPLPPCRR